MFDVITLEEGEKRIKTQAWAASALPVSYNYQTHYPQQYCIYIARAPDTSLSGHIPPHFSCFYLNYTLSETLMSPAWQ